MTLTAERPATDRQLDYLRDLARTRRWDALPQGPVVETVHDVLGDVGGPAPHLIGLGEASRAIAALRSCPSVVPVPNLPGAPTTALAATLARLPLSRYALPRVAGGEWDFLEVVERPDGARYVNRLVGSPGGWRRHRLDARLAWHAARHIAEDPRAAAVAYARRHGRCAVCDAHLSDPTSIARSLGPVCARRFV